MSLQARWFVWLRVDSSPLYCLVCVCERHTYRISRLPFSAVTGRQSGHSHAQKFIASSPLSEGLSHYTRALVTGLSDYHQFIEEYCCAYNYAARHIQKPTGTDSRPANLLGGNNSLSWCASWKTRTFKRWKSRQVADCACLAPQ